MDNAEVKGAPAEQQGGFSSPNQDGYYNTLAPTDQQELIRYNLIANAARTEGITVPEVFCKEGLFDDLRNPSYWQEPQGINPDEPEIVDIDLYKPAGKNCLTDYCNEISNIIKFPRNSVLLHGLGIVSSAMNMHFNYDYHGSEKAVNLYTVVAQPPSTGKSGVNELLNKEVKACYKELADKNKVFRMESQLKIKRLEIEINKSQVTEETRSLMEKKIEEEKLLDTVPNWQYSVNDTTAEALESMAGTQQGLFNVVSDESDAINVLLGAVYKEGSSKSNHGLLLSAWDSNPHDAIRNGRETKSFIARGCIAVIAQPEAINTILKVGESGRGVSERFLLLNEPNLLGTRTHSNKRIEINKEIKAAYEQTIKNIVLGDRVVLTFAGEAIAVMNEYRNTIEPLLADNGEYSSSMIRGSLGKSDKMILKIACILHTVEQWRGRQPSKKTVVQEKTMVSAVLIYRSLMETYIQAADDQGFVGKRTELGIIVDWLKSYKEKRKKRQDNGLNLKITQLRDGIKNKPVFEGIKSSKLKDVYLPLLVNKGILVFKGPDVFINPLLE